MSIKEQHFNYAQQKLEQRRAANKSLFRQRMMEIHKAIPEYAQLETSLADTAHRLILQLMTPTAETSEAVEELKAENIAIQDRMNELLKKHGFSKEYTMPVYSCPICKDNGTTGTSWCSCFNKLMLEAAANDMNTVSPLSLSRFEDFRLQYYSKELLASIGSCPYDIMATNLEYCKAYADGFTPNSNSILMRGATGLGKTHLSLAIANEVLKKGYSVVYSSTPELMRTLDREHFGRADTDTMDTVTRCDLLILDDIGAETDKKLYTSLLYEIINTRMCKSMPTIVNTNLSGKLLQEKYEDRIASRLTSFETLYFCGNDVRRMIQNT